MSIVINLSKAKTISHDIRRAARAEEFKPYDDLIAKQIPGSETAEAERVKIREKYAAIQTQIDMAQSAAELKSIVHTLPL